MRCGGKSRKEKKEMGWMDGEGGRVRWEKRGEGKKKFYCLVVAVKIMIFFYWK